MYQTWAGAGGKNAGREISMDEMYDIKIVPTTINQLQKEIFGVSNFKCISCLLQNSNVNDLLRCLLITIMAIMAKFFYRN